MMNREIRVALTLIVAVVIVLPSSLYATGKEVFEGQMEGLNCVVHGHTCPVDNLDPHIAYEPDFVLHLGSTKHYLLLNVPLVVKARHVGEPIRVTGEANTKYNAIKVEKLEVKRSGKYHTVWSKKLQDQEWQKWQEEFYDGAGAGDR
jgi:hypothetical protein